MPLMYVQCAKYSLTQIGLSALHIYPSQSLRYPSPPPSPFRCPHVREVCRNRGLHPRADFLYLKNAEVETFNGCGYCKWARTEPPATRAGLNNPGWPGCCRPPAPSEYRMIPAADWRSVSIVHNVALPPEVKSALEILSPKPTSTSSPTLRSGVSKSAIPPLDRRSSGSNSPPTKSATVPSKSFTPPSIATSKSRPGGSPKQASASLSASLSRASGSAALSGGPASSLDQPPRRPAIIDTSEKSILRSGHSSPGRKQIDLDNSVTPRRNSGSRSTNVNTTPNSASAKGTGESRSSPGVSSERRRGASVSTVSTNSPPKSSQATKTATTPAAFNLPRTSQKEAGNNSSASSNNGSDDRSSDSMSDSTITSDGGFTDYLSDESEAELQRQAEARAALLAQNQAEELEFRAARQQLAHVDLRPPKSWNPANITNNNSAPRLVQTGKTM
uniref:Uncharacterized protein n=1 Tax=Moniliophthora roreri TaxID=221103 RepID=A0A0W0FCW2_MONRR